MEDFERYGDYDNIEDDEPRKRSIISLILKLLILLVVVSVVAVLGFRLVLFNNYPDSAKNIYFNDKLTAYYYETDGKIGAQTQSLRAKYDDAEEGNFFCDNLIVIKGINQLQVSLRYNVSLMDKIKEEHGIDASADDQDLFTFKLSVLPLVEGASPRETGELSEAIFDSRLMYRYYKLVFDGVDFEIEDADELWIRLEIYFKGNDSIEPYCVLVYEDTEEYSKLEDYKLSSEEKPKNDK